MVPGRSVSSGSTSSEPVETTATLTRGRTRTRERPTEARAEIAVADRRVRAPRTGSPTATSSPAVRTDSPTQASALIATWEGSGW